MWSIFREPLRGTSLCGFRASWLRRDYSREDMAESGCQTVPVLPGDQHAASEVSCPSKVQDSRS